MAHTPPSGFTFLQRLDSEGRNREAAWRLLYERYWDYIIHFSMSRGLARPEAEIVLQETMARLLVRLPYFRQTYPSKGSFRSFVIGIAKYVCFEEFRRRATHARRNEDLDGGSTGSNGVGPPLADKLASSDMRETLRLAEEKAFQLAVLRRAMEALRTSVDGKTWDIFAAYVREEGEDREIAERFGVQPNNVYQIKNRLRERLRILSEPIRAEMEA